MARIINLNDGTNELMLSDDEAQELLLDIIERKLGADCADLFTTVVKSQEESSELFHQELDSYEETLDSYRSAMQEAIESLRSMINYINGAKRLNRDKILSTLSLINNSLWNEP